MISTGFPGNSTGSRTPARGDPGLARRVAGLVEAAGQYMFITTGTGTDALTKHLTITSSSSDPHLEVTKGSTGHPFAESLRLLKAGNQVVLRGPFGEFTFRANMERLPSSREASASRPSGA